jgi:hypothetical protein
MELYKLGIKIFVANPGAVNPRDFIPVFHAWIKEQKIAGHLLIDVHDYSHVQNGPGILLVAHEGNFSLDQAEGRLGLVYYRKQPVAGDSLKITFESARSAARLLEGEPTLNGIRFRTNEFLVFSNDRLLAPNTAEARVELETAIRNTFPGATISLALRAADPRERLAFVVKPG